MNIYKKYEIEDKFTGAITLWISFKVFEMDVVEQSDLVETTISTEPSATFFIQVPSPITRFSRTI